jgi:hypothetical protein
MKLKMWVGNFDGAREGLVIAPTKKRAIEVTSRSGYDFNNYWTERFVDASLDPEVLYTRPYGKTDVAWQRGRCSL